MPPSWPEAPRSAPAGIDKENDAVLAAGLGLLGGNQKSHSRSGRQALGSIAAPTSLPVISANSGSDYTGPSKSAPKHKQSKYSVISLGVEGVKPANLQPKNNLGRMRERLANRNAAAAGGGTRMMR